MKFKIYQDLENPIHFFYSTREFYLLNELKFYLLDFNSFSTSLFQNILSYLPSLGQINSPELFSNLGKLMFTQIESTTHDKIQFFKEFPTQSVKGIVKEIVTHLKKVS